jgi:twitching motility protein PilT
MITDPARTAEIRRAIFESGSAGMQTFDQSLMDLLRRDLISPEEALAHCSNLGDFQLALGGVMTGEGLRGIKKEPELVLDSPIQIQKRKR